MHNGAFAQDIAVSQVGLNEGNLFNGEVPLLVGVEGTAEGFQPRNNSLPGVLWEWVLRAIVWCDD